MIIGPSRFKWHTHAHARTHAHTHAHTFDAMCKKQVCVAATHADTTTCSPRWRCLDQSPSRCGSHLSWCASSSPAAPGAPLRTRERRRVTWYVVIRVSKAEWSSLILLQWALLASIASKLYTYIQLARGGARDLGHYEKKPHRGPTTAEREKVTLFYKKLILT